MATPIVSAGFTPASSSSGTRHGMRTLHGVQVPAHERLVLDSGVTLLILPLRDVPLVSFHAVLRGGELADPHPGLASLVAGLLEKGAGSRDAYAFAEAVEGVGGSFSASANVEALGLRGQFLARDQGLMLELLADALRRPRLEAQELEKLRERQIELIKAAKDSDPSELLGTYARAFLFKDHPYGQPVIGSETSLEAITLEHAQAYYRSQVGADRLTVIFAGDLDPLWLKRAAAQAFAGWSPAASPPPSVPHPERPTSRRVLLIDAPGSVQTYFWIGSVGVDRHYPLRAALDLVNTLYGGRFTSLLNTELRIKSGLSYGARSGFMQGSVPGEFAIRSFAQTENTARALDLSLDTLARLKREGITQEMLDSARAYVLGQFPLSFETAGDWAAALAELELYGLTPADIEGYGPELERVTLAHAHTVIEQAFPDPDTVQIVVIGDARQIRSQLRSYGPVTQMALNEPHFGP